MKGFKIMLVLLVIIALPLTASAQKAKTIDELAKMFDSSGCKSCHAEIYSQWEKSHHARPLMGVKGGLMLTPLATKGATAFSPDDPKKATLKNFPCFKCHLPQAVTSAEDSVAVELAEALLAKDSAKVAKLQITCIVCHNNKAIIHKRELGEPEKGVLYGSKNVDAHGDKTFTKVKKSAIMHESVFCGQCHGQGPNLEFDQAFQCANLYGSYMHAYIPAGGTQTCQDCHMKKGDHLIAPNFNDDKATSELLAKAINLDVQTIGYEWLRKAATYVPKIVVETKITTTAGHRIPDG
ncbi:MAG: cytochrome c family protein [Nitrospirae bacterium]|nr:cytochrome c family protein [Nitrospirota bacterium]MCL5422140.1 cytochrome c family protein [Nitrospirota bacterium]